MVLLAFALYGSRMFDIRPVARTALVDSIQDAMMVVDEQGRLVDYNRAATDLLDGSDTIHIGRPARDVLPPSMLALLRHEAHAREEVAMDGGMGTRWAEVDVTPLTTNRRFSGHLLISRDITSRKLAQEALQASREALEAANRRLEQQSITDGLTGLHNRRFLFERLEQEVDRHRRSGLVLSLLVLDIDHFKQINDTHGHPTGDRAICAVADAIRRVTRATDVTARIGGEEFAVIAVDSHPEGPGRLAERLRGAIADIRLDPPLRPGMRLTASIGVAQCRHGSSDAERLFSEADRRLYTAKNQGRDRVICGPPPVSAIMPDAACPRRPDIGGSRHENPYP
jgi:diguanylate cyclase (GGDEF)-like protein/PAS domain S-box-containing protein